MTGTVLTDDAGDGVRVITLNRPHRLNAIVPELLEDLIAALLAADRDPAIGAIVLTGAGRAFCSGDDLKEFGSQTERRGGDARLYRTHPGCHARDGAWRHAGDRRDPWLGGRRRTGMGDQLRLRHRRRRHPLLLPGDRVWVCSSPAA